jgi:ectoine hydroxylase-related dioxygenase (phytanoyl-CoA dioxygenase family)
MELMMLKRLKRWVNNKWRKKYEGFVEEFTVDSLGNGTVKGWCVDRASPARPVTVRVMLNDKILAIAQADGPRPDLVANGIGKGAGGFEIAISGLPLDAEVLVFPDGWLTPLIRLRSKQAGSEPATVTARQVKRLKARSPFFKYIPADIADDRVNTATLPDIGLMAWLDRDDSANLIAAAERSGYLTPKGAKLCRRFAEDGYVVIEGAISERDCDVAWQAFDSWSRAHPDLIGGPVPSQVVPAYGRLLNIHKHVPEMHSLLHHPVITDAIDMLLGFKCIPFQTIPSYFGSEQLAHSDAIHMATFPLGFLAAAWIALEDITPDSGPLLYYPGSHKLPYMLSREVGIDVREARIGTGVYHERYEPAIAALVRDRGLTAKYFTAKKGDALIWHHNLVHGGSPVSNVNSTRKSLVCHYFTDSALCYHDLTGSIADVDIDQPPSAEIIEALRTNSHSAPLHN